MDPRDNEWHGNYAAQYTPTNPPAALPSSPVSELVVELRAFAANSLIDRTTDRLTALEAENAKLREVAQNIINTMSSTYTARNGRVMGIEADDGEKCYIVHSDQIEELRAALSASPQGGDAEAERIQKGMERILKEQSERDIPFTPQGGDHE